MATQKTFDLGIEEARSLETVKAATAELIGTALFVFLGVGSFAAMLATAPGLGGGLVIIAAAHGLAFALIVAAAAPISGGHINPAITFALIITGLISVGKGAVYILAQLIGAVLGMGLLRALLVDDVLLTIPGAGGLALNDGDEGMVSSAVAGMGIEAVITFVLVWTVFATVVNPQGPRNLAPVYIGFAVFAFHLVAVPLTGASANPARSFGPELVNGRWDDFWIYYLGSLLGAGIAAIAYYLLYLMPWDFPRANRSREVGAGQSPSSEA